MVPARRQVWSDELLKVVSKARNQNSRLTEQGGGSEEILRKLWLSLAPPAAGKPHGLCYVENISFRCALLYGSGGIVGSQRSPMAVV